MNERTLYKIDNIILILIFGFAIYAPFLIGIIQDDKISSGVEKRNLAKFPSSPESLKAISDYPKALNTYYSDHFGFREVLTKIYFVLANKLGSQSSVDDVTIGQDGWLFLGSIKEGYLRHNDPIGDAINVNLFSKKELEDFARSIMSIKNWLSKKGIEYIYVIAPNKHTIYFDKLPKYILKKNKESATDQIIKYLQEHTNVPVVDLRPALLEEKKKHLVYFKSDTHWNHYGANVAQYIIMNKIKSLLPGKITTSLLTGNQFKISTRKGGDLAEFAKIENVIEDNPQPIFDVECSSVDESPDTKAKKTYTMTCVPQKPNVVIFRDSFFTYLQPYISRQFNRSTYIWERMNYKSLVKYVELEKPSIVIDEVVERTLPYIPSNVFFNNIH
ncbi:MAG: hypothetical protein IMY67_04925 [Bacteroidetes bacterium]|nr:hypothetical protein [Bacteroidota bacterium]